MELFNSWREGRTGYPIVDSNMVELKLSGYMSNRGRQIVASFLVNDLGVDWRMGAQHFETYLIDYDPTQNYGNWNYCAGVGADPVPNRYFNIVNQVKNYDPHCKYILHWLPLLANLPISFITEIYLISHTQRQ